MKRVLLTAVLAMTALTSSCAGQGRDDLDICQTILVGAAIVPCAIAYGAGCVVGAGTRCCESAGPDEPQEPAPSSSASSSELAPATAEVRDVAY